MDDRPATLEISKEPTLLGNPLESKVEPANVAGRRGMKFSYPDGSTPLEGYTIKRGIGIGGFGEVYFALSDAGKEVALKKIQRNLDVELRGVRQCLNLKHVNLISLWDIRTNSYGESWVVMEYVPGPSLRDIIHEHKTGMPEEDVKAWFASTAAGVAYLHDKGIVHRDLKPGNIFCDEDSHVIKIGDYGLSKFISCSRRSGHTESVGTFHYMAPEIGKGVYGKQIDIYAMAIVLFEMLTGDVPFNGESSQEIIMKHLTSDPDVSAVPEKFQKLIRKALAKDPQRRYPDVPAMIADLPWPELAANSKRIIRQNSVGRMPLVEESETEVAAVSFGKLTTKHPGSPDRVHHSQLPPVIIDSSEMNVVPDIVFGPLNDASQYGLDENNSVTVTSSHNGSIAAIETNSVENSAENVDPINVLRQSNSGNEVPVPNLAVSHVIHAEEPIAKAVQSAWTPLLGWWNTANFSAPVKMILLVVGGLVVVQNSQWLLPLVLVTGVAYLTYCLIRTWYLTEDGSAKSLSPREIRKRQIADVRTWLSRRPSMDRTTELVGSFLIAALACVVLNLLGMALGGGLVESNVETWSRYVWLTLTSIAACWALLGGCKAWERREGDSVLRRITTIGIGISIGAIAYFSAGSFDLKLAELTAADFTSMKTTSYVLESVPMLPAFLIFFGGLFGILRWWRLMDPVRRTRLSTLSVAFSLVWAIVLSHLLNVPLTLVCIFAVVISVSIQLASPWLHPTHREEISAELNSELAG